MIPLPIDAVLPEITETLLRARRIVLLAPPGAGKTTRVPRALLDAGVGDQGEIVVLEPRRLAARLAARRVAEELGEELGGRVGYTVRFDDRTGRATKVRFVTDGVLTRWMVRDPSLAGVAAVLVDEVHERHLQADVALALLRRLSETRRPELLVGAMSATIDAGRVAAYLSAPIVRSEGRAFAIDVRHADAPPARPLATEVAVALRGLFRDGLDGHALVFLPGAREIRAAQAACEPVARDVGAVVMPLHGDLTPDEQDRVLAPSRAPKIILSTNVAESSVTVDGVAAVVDSGLARTASCSPWTGLSSLKIDKISRASAAQRAGRAGRTRAGVCVRLYTKGDLERRPEHDAPELARADLCELALQLAELGVSAADLAWLDAPPEPSMRAAQELLERLGALDDGRLTPLGRQLLRLPVHPRLGRAAIEAARRGHPLLGAAAAAALAERDVLGDGRARFDRGPRAHGERGDSDVTPRAQLVLRASRERLSAAQIKATGGDPSATLAAVRACERLLRALPRDAGDAPPLDEDDALGLALLAGFPDRVAARKRAGGDALVMSSGGALTQAADSVVVDAPLVVVVSADGDPARPLARLVSRVLSEWLLELFPERLRDEAGLEWDGARERVESVERLMYDAVAIDEVRRRGGDPVAVGALLASMAEKRGLSAFVRDQDAWVSLLARLSFVAAHDPGFPAVDAAGVSALVAAAAVGRSSFEELREVDLAVEIEQRLAPEQRAQLREWAPPRLTLPSGRQAKITYAPGQEPFVASRMQDFFGMREAPTIAGGRALLVVHLLAPNQRPVQVTRDLAGFWERHWPSLRKELGRKYPKHHWPEDPSRPAR
ncbi:MAG: ATP-dependent helicase HrpB [Polyangiaceae bacterium]|nr:ATP-dependent helicase HrpB [Polyangiaceae bacterium]